MELEVRDKVVCWKKGHCQWKHHHKGFSEQFKAPPCFYHIGCGMNRMGSFSSGTSIYLSYVRSFLLRWEKYGVPLDERKFKLMKCPQPTPGL